MPPPRRGHGGQPTYAQVVPDLLQSGAVGPLTDTSTVTLITGVPDRRLYLRHLLVSNAHASVTAVVELRENGTRRWVGVAGNTGGGWSESWPEESPLVFGKGNAIQVVSVTNGAAVYASAVAAVES